MLCCSAQNQAGPAPGPPRPEKMHMSDQTQKTVPAVAKLIAEQTARFEAAVAEMNKPQSKRVAQINEFVEGASRGLGRAIALRLAEDGAQVALNFRSGEEQAREVADQIHPRGGTGLLFRADVSVKDEARGLIGAVLEQWGHLDILVNNAGITRDRSMRKLTDDDWTDVINTNLNSVYYCTSAALKPMIERK